MNGCLHAKMKCHNRCGKVIPRHGILLHEMEECSQKRDDHTELEKSMRGHIQMLLDERQQLDQQIDEVETGYFKSKKEVHPNTSGPDESGGEDIPRHDILLHEIEKRYPKRDDHTELEKSLYFHMQTLLCEVEQKEIKLLKLKKEVHPITSNPEESATVVPVQRTITSFAEKQKLNLDYVSVPFYTHPGGYKMCLWVFPNGYAASESTYLSLFTSFMQGENDAELKWPFRGNITVQLIDQV